MNQPKVIFVLSGKRKSGKDYVANQLLEMIGIDRCQMIHLSSPLKYEYSNLHNLDYEKLMSCGPYKEIHRKAMIKWGEDKRIENPEYFCEKAIENVTSSIWIVTDARRVVDIEYFQKNFKDATVLVRIQASNQLRCQRGWKFVSGVDDAESECALDFLDQSCCELIENDNCHQKLVNKLHFLINKYIN